ncbi:MAG: hypothetical protein U9R27_02895 [Campylobacterota bacterium]|nr:hypothetical protein [Campylobacterota bacterium]
MKQLEEERIDQLLGIINLYPAIRVMHFSDGSQQLTQKINTLCEQHHYDYQLNCTTDTCYEEMIDRYGDEGMIKIKRFDLNRPRYAIQAKLYDYLFVTTQIPDEERLSFLKKTYAAIKNAGLILIFLPKDDLRQNHIWSELLLENYFVASNTLDIFADYDVIIAKKMHGWGG